MPREFPELEPPPSSLQKEDDLEEEFTDEEPEGEEPDDDEDDDEGAEEEDDSDDDEEPSGTKSPQKEKPSVTIKNKAKHAYAERGMEFLIEQAENRKNTPEFRKKCWDEIRDIGWGKPATQKPTEDGNKKPKLLVGNVNRKDIIKGG